MRGSCHENTNPDLVIALIGTADLRPRRPASAQDDEADPTKDLLGTWDAQTEDGGRSLVFKFFLEKDELKGLYTGQAGESKMEDLKVEGNKVTFVVKIGGDQGMVISFTAFFTGDEMNGMLSLQFGEANFSGQKRGSHPGAQTAANPGNRDPSRNLHEDIRDNVNPADPAIRGEASPAGRTRALEIRSCIVRRGHFK